MEDEKVERQSRAIGKQLSKETYEGKWARCTKLQKTVRNQISSIRKRLRRIEMKKIEKLRCKREWEVLRNLEGKGAGVKVPDSAIDEEGWVSEEAKEKRIQEARNR